MSVTGALTFIAFTVALACVYFGVLDVAATL